MTTGLGPTEKQQKCLEYIKQFMKEQGRSPTLRNIKEQLDLKAHSAVWAMLRRMEERGLVKIHLGKANGIEIL